MGDQEWRDDLFLYYIIYPKELPLHCDGYNAKISICHALDCKKGGLIMTYHKNLCDGVADITITPSSIHVVPCGS